MKKMKKIVSIVLAMVMVMAMMTFTAFAENTIRHTITITNTKAGHEYTAYQVFKGDITGGKLTNIEWGIGVNGVALLDALKEMESSPYSNCKDAKDVADKLAEFENNSEQLDAFAKVVGNHLTATSAGKSSAQQSPYTIEVVGDGYYFVKDTKEIAENDAATKYILNVVGDVTIKAKADVPELDKKIKGEDNTTSTTTNAAIGDTVDFELTSKVPDMDGYNKYYFIVNDTMSKGLDFNNDVAISIGNSSLTKDTDYSVESTKNEADGTTAIKIVFNNFINHKSQAGQIITITYSATVNEDAVIGTTGNPNKADLTYSNNPNHTYEGEENVPGSNDPTGKTPESKTITYVTGLKLLKVNANDKKPLAGAQFEITGTKLNTVLVKSQKYVEDANGTYYLLKDGTYTEEKPNDNEQHNANYESTTIKYKLTTVTETFTKSEDVQYKATTGNDGIIQFDGLAAGTYKIKEIKAPDGYNKVDDIDVTISWQAPAEDNEDNEICTWTATGANVDKDGLVTLTVENRSGSLLPSTGGIGTTIFYVLGAIMVIGAGVVLVSKKRMEK